MPLETMIWRPRASRRGARENRTELARAGRLLVALGSSLGGSWTEPRAACGSSSGAPTDSAFWIGLGGYSGGSSALEQVGTEADCTAAGAASYSAWFELVPAASVKLPLTVAAGDRISAAVNVEGRTVTIALEDMTTRKRVARTLLMAAPATSSAEWIAEAPSAVTPHGTEVLPLTDFGTVAFSGARATTTFGHTGTISDPAWSSSAITLETPAGGPGQFGRFAGQISEAQAVPGPLRSGGRAFSVTWQEEPAQGPPSTGGPPAPSFRLRTAPPWIHSQFTGSGARIDT